MMTTTIAWHTDYASSHKKTTRPSSPTLSKKWAALPKRITSRKGKRKLEMEVHMNGWAFTENRVIAK
ncbi:MAG: hypothetical protein GY816_16310 [Cytophagales bacterium]|nr:hypothetical protein [Cytophagales bacterium]